MTTLPASFGERCSDVRVLRYQGLSDMQGELPPIKNASALGLWEGRVMIDIVGMTAVGFLVCMAVAKASDAVTIMWLTRHKRRSWRKI